MSNHTPGKDWRVLLIEVTETQHDTAEAALADYEAAVSLQEQFPDTVDYMGVSNILEHWDGEHWVPVKEVLRGPSI